MFELNEKVAIVTGGNGGIGLGMAHGLAKAGAHIAIFGRNPEKNTSAVRELEAHKVRASAHAVDVTSASAIEDAVGDVADRYGRLDILVNNAGMNISTRPEALLEEDWHTVMDTNVTSAFLCSQKCYPHFQKAGRGKILNCGSMYSLFGSHFSTAYGASKGAIVQLTRSLAASWAAENIQVNCFLPGWINTDLTARGKKRMPDLKDNVLKRTPAGRWGEPSDLEGIAVFLASEASDFITGTAIPVDGGYSICG
jgi:2-deoxy-D-gluconate 3-dehydrogenase